MIKRYTDKNREYFFQEALDASMHFLERMQESISDYDYEGFLEHLDSYTKECDPLNEFDFYDDFNDNEKEIAISHYHQICMNLSFQFKLFKFMKSDVEDVVQKRKQICSFIYIAFERCIVFINLIKDDKIKLRADKYFQIFSQQIIEFMELQQ